MAWEASLAHPAGSFLGTSDSVRQTVSRWFPSTEWHMSSGTELLSQFEQLGNTISPEFRADLLQIPSHWCGVFDTEPVSVEFTLSYGDGDDIRLVGITSRGDHLESQRRLRALAQEMGWVLKNDFS